MHQKSVQLTNEKMQVKITCQIGKITEMGKTGNWQRLELAKPHVQY